MRIISAWIGSLVGVLILASLVRGAGLWNVLIGIGLFVLVIVLGLVLLVIVARLHSRAIANRPIRFVFTSFTPNGEILVVNSKGAIERYATEPWTRLFHINALSADSSKHKLSGDGSILAWWAPEDEDGGGSAVVLSEVNTGKDLQSEWFDQDNCSSVFISPDGSLFGVVDQIKQIHLWDVKTGEKVSVSSDPRSNEVSFEFAEFVVFSPDGRFLCGSDVDVVYIWDLAIKEQVQILRGHSHISALSYSPDGKLLAVADEGSIRSWDLGSGEETCRIEVMKGRIDRMAFSPDGRLLAGSRDPRILWLADVSMGALLFDLRFSDAEIECLSFSPDSRQLIALTKGARLHRWLLADDGRLVSSRTLADNRWVPLEVSGRKSL